MVSAGKDQRQLNQLLPPWGRGWYQDSLIFSSASPRDLSPALLGRERGERGLFLILSRQKIFWYFMHMRGKAICEFTVKN